MNGRSCLWHFLCKCVAIRLPAKSVLSGTILSNYLLLKTVHVWFQKHSAMLFSYILFKISEVSVILMSLGVLVKPEHIKGSPNF